MTTPLETARQHVVEGERIVAEQEQVVDALRKLGKDTGQAEELLKSFQASLALVRDDLTREEARGSSDPSCP